jgi:uncharacterized membrane protein
MPTVTVTLGPDSVAVDVSAGPAKAVFNGTVAVSGLPLVRYRLNISAEAGGWECVCDPGTHPFTQSVNLSYTVTVTVPAGAGGGDFRSVNVTANLTTTGLPIASGTASAGIEVNQTFGVRIISGVAVLRVDSGKTVSWPLSLLNTGNGRDTLGVKVANPSAFTSNNWALKFNRTSAYGVETGASALFQLNITPPAGAPNQTVMIQVTGLSRGAASSDLTVEDQAFLNLTVNHVPATGGGGNKPSAPKATAGAGPLLIVAAVAAALVALGRKRM